MGMRQRIIQVSGFCSLVILPVQIIDAKSCRQRSHFLPVTVVAQINMHFFRIGIFHPRTSPERLIKQFYLFTVGRDKNVHIRELIKRHILRKRVVLHRIHIGKVNKGLHHAKHFHHQKTDARHNRYHSVPKRNGKKDSPYQVHDGKKHIQEKPDFALPVVKKAANKCTEAFLFPRHP